MDRCPITGRFPCDVFRCTGIDIMEKAVQSSENLNTAQPGGCTEFSVRLEKKNTVLEKNMGLLHKCPIKNWRLEKFSNRDFLR